MSTPAKRLYRFGPFRLDLQQRVLFRGDDLVHLAPKALDTLSVLVSRSGHVVAKEELLTTLWPETFIEDSNLNQQVFLLRKALGEQPDGGPYIETVPKRGYRFVAEVREMQEEGPGEGRAGAAERRVLAAAGRPKLAVALVIVAITGLAALAFQLWKGSAPGAQVSIAVLPLDNVSADPSQEYFSDGMTDALIANLAMIRGLRVISRTSAMAYKGAQKSARQISEELEVQYLVEGSLLREGDQVRIMTHLIDAPNDRQLWSERFERNVRDVLTLQREVAYAITKQIQIKLTAREQDRLTDTRPIDPAVYEAYLKGLFHLDSWTPPELQLSLEYFQEVIAKDPQFAPAYVGLALIYRRLAVLGESNSKEALSRSKQMSLWALQLDEQSVEAHISLALNYCFDWDWTACEKELRYASELNPNNALLHAVYGNICLTPQGRLDQALREQRLAARLDPLSPFHYSILGKIYHYRGEHDQAIEQFERALELDPNFIFARLFLGFLLVDIGDYEEGIPLLEVALLAGTAPELAYLGHGYGLAGRSEEAQGILRQLEERLQSEHPPFEAIARVYLGLGDKERALELLERSCDDRDPRLLWLKTDPLYDSLRDEPRFQAMLARMNLDE